MPAERAQSARAPMRARRQAPGKEIPLRLRRIVAVVAVVLGMLAAVVAIVPASAAMAPAATAGSPYQRGPDPTPASVAATRGTFATAELGVPPGNGFNGGTIYYPTESGLGTWGAVAIVPGYTARFADEEAWMGHWLASFGFVVIGVETNSRTDFDTARGTQLLAALDYVTQKSPVRDRVDPGRLAVVGHSMGGGGALVAAERRPTLKAAVGLAPFKPSGSPTGLRVPTMIMGGDRDTTVTPSYLDGLYAALPGTTQSAYLQLSGADHLFATRANTLEMRILIPWLKTFVDDDTRYTPFLCPTLADPTGVSRYRATCPLVPPGGATPTPTPTTSPTPDPPAPGGVCQAVYRTVNSWPGGYQGEVTVRAGSAAIDGWTVGLTLPAGQSVTQVWNGILGGSGTSVTVRNAPYNGSLQASAATTFGFTGDGTPPTAPLTCAGP
ncbi:cellulose binding domain-containing protein [Streptomyces griseosporeus]|uniref:poly(ethylene terephthalate) hydrolase family protein n=1 Tax=Streptomyces griseosporeus TaxID=1910 RepID=UPI0037005BA0